MMAPTAPEIIPAKTCNNIEGGVPSGLKQILIWLVKLMTGIKEKAKPYNVYLSTMTEYIPTLVMVSEN